MRVGRFALVLALGVSCALPCLAQAPAQSVADINASGAKPFASLSGNDIEYVDNNNGGLNVRIPLVTKKGRGLAFDLNITYSSKFWNAINDPTYGAAWNLEGDGTSGNSVGWDAAFLNLTSGYANIICYDPNNPDNYELSFVFHDSDGTKHAFQNQTPTSCTSGYPRDYSVDMTGLMLKTTSYVGNPTPHTLYVSNGVRYKFNKSIIGQPATFFYLPDIEDTNGNLITSNFVNGAYPNGQDTETWTDTLGGTIAVRKFGPSQTFVSPLGNSIGARPLASVSFTDSNGNSQTYTFTWTAVDVSCNFQYPACIWHQGAILVLSQITLPNGLSYRFGYKDTSGNYNPGAELMRIDLPSGGYVRYEYQTLSKGENTADLGAVDSRVVSKRVHSADGVHEDVWLYSYTRSYIFSGAVVGQKTTTIADPSNNQEAYTFDYLNSYSEIQFFETTHKFFQGSATLVKRIDQGWQYDNVSCLSFFPNCNGTGNVNHRVTSRTVTWPQTNQVSQATFAYDQFSFDRGNLSLGNVIQTQEYDYGTGSPGTLLRSTVSSFLTTNPVNGVDYTSDNLHIWRKPSSEAVHTGAANGPIVAQTQYEYDSYTQGLTSSGAAQHDSSYGTGYTTRGNLTATKRWRNTDGAWLTTRNQFDDAGNTRKTTDPQLHSTTFSYGDSWGNSACAPSSGSAAAYVTSVTNALSQVTRATYNSCTGTIASTTDENNQTTYLNYDLMGRLTQQNFPDTGRTTYCYTDVGGSTCTRGSAPFSIITTKKINGLTNLTSTTNYDGLGRPIQSQLNSDPDCASGDKSDTTYDGLGRVLTVSNPYCTTGDQTYGITTYAYNDALGRTTQVTHQPDGSSVLISYTGRATRVQDEGNGTQRVTRISQTDALGRLTSVCEVSSASLIGSGGTPAACGQDIAGPGFLTTYQYDALDNLLQVNQSGIGARVFGYDSLSRLTNANNSESGTITYSYDDNGNLHTKTDARNITTCFGDWTGTTCNGATGYDALNRVLKKTYSDGTPAATFNYDQTSALGVTLTNTTGRKSSETTAGSFPTGSVFSYDPMGRLANNSQCTPQNCGSGVFAIQYPQYDFVGNLLTGTNAAGVTFTYTYNTAARLTGISSNFVDPTHPGTLLSQATYNPPALLKTVLLGNGLTETRNYDSRLRLTSLTAGTVYSLNMAGYAPNGDVLAANDSVNNNWTYMYDAFNRLTCSNLTSNGTCASPTNGTPTYTYAYDRFGNRWHQTGPYTMNLSFSAANNRMDGHGYDAAGNLLNDGNYAYTYDAENRISQVSLPGGAFVASYVYDAQGRRARKTTTSGTLDFLYDAEGHKVAEIDPTGTFLRGELFAAGRHFAVFAPEPGPTGATFFIHADWLGTERARTNMTGTACETITSLPFGDGQTISDSCGDSAGDVSPMHFTGKERDSESGLDNFGKRYFGSSFGRFQTPDPVTISWRRMVNPQLWNAYSYVGNNPLGFVDPTGEELVQLGQHTDDEIKKRKKEIGQELKNKDLTKEQKDALKKERNTLNLEQEGNHVVGNLLAKLDQTGQRNGLQLSKFTLSTDTKNDFAGVATPAAMQKLLNDQAFVIQDNKQFSGTIYIRTEPETGFYQLSQRDSDFGYYLNPAYSQP